MIGGDALPASYDQAIAGLAHELIAVVRQTEPVQAAVVADHIAVTNHVDLAVNRHAAGGIEIVGLVVHYLAIGNHLSVQRAHHQAVIAIHGERSHDIISVSELMIGKAVVEEAVEPLIGCHPQAIPPVDHHVFDKIDARRQFPQLIAIIFIERMRIGQNQLAVLQPAGDDAVVRSLEMEGGLQPETQGTDDIDAVAGKGQQLAVGAQQGKDVGA